MGVSGKLSYKQIFIFWIPLAATWFIMSIENPFLTAVIARMAEPKHNLAAYGVAFSLAILIESPVIMMMSASTALVKGRYSFQKLRKFTYTINIILTLVMLVLVIPAVFYFVAEDLVGLSRRVTELTHIATIILIPWPGAIGYRRFYQGIMINHDQTRKVAYGTIIRLLSMTGTALILFFFFEFDGVVVGASALSAGVVMESLASKLMSVDIIKEFKKKDKNVEEELTYKQIFEFYYPLALTSLIALGVHPMVTFFLGQARMSLESLAVLPVINGLVFIFRGVGLSYQEVGIALLDRTKENYPQIRNFAIYGGLGVVAALSIVAFTPLSEIWFSRVSGLSNELTSFAKLPLMIVAVMPGLTFLISFQRSILVSVKRTKPITAATAIEVVTILLVLFIAISWLNLIGIIAAGIAFILGRLAANSYLMKPFVNAVRKF